MCINTSMPTLRQYEVSLEHMTFKIGLKQTTRAESTFRESKKGTVARQGGVAGKLPITYPSPNPNFSFK